MESFVGLILVIAVIAGLIFFKKMIKHTAQYCSDVVATNINEANVDLIRRSTEVMKQINEEFNGDYCTPEEAYNKLMKKRRKVVQKQQ